MNIRIIYDSVFGNTEKIAQAIGNGLEHEQDVKVIKVDQVEPKHLRGVNLLIVGSPTRAFRPTPALTQFLKQLPKDSLRGVKTAAFDTRIAVEDTNSRFLNLMVRLFGYADKPIADMLKKKGGELINPSGGFIVEGTEGPLKEGEIERATEWAKYILAQCS